MSSVRSMRPVDPKIALQQYMEGNQRIKSPLRSVPPRSLLETPKKVPSAGFQLPLSSNVDQSALPPSIDVLHDEYPVRIESPQSSVGRAPSASECSVSPDDATLHSVADETSPVHESRAASEYDSIFDAAPDRAEAVDRVYSIPIQDASARSFDDAPSPNHARSSTTQGTSAMPPDPRLDPSIGDEKFRANYRAKLAIFREEYPKMNIPEITDKHARQDILDIYDSYVRRIEVEHSVSQNNMYLLIMWLVIEFVGTSMFNLPIEGYTENQFKYMKKYHMLLVELGERRHATGKSGWAPEYRILFLAGVNGVLYLLVQMISQQIGANNQKFTAMTENLRDKITEWLTSNGERADVLHRADHTDVDHPAEEAANPGPPTGQLTSMVGAAKEVLNGAGLGGVMNMMSSFMGGGNSAPSNTAEPQVKRPKRRRRRGFAARGRQSARS